MEVHRHLDEELSELRDSILRLGGEAEARCFEGFLERPDLGEPPGQHHHVPRPAGAVLARDGIAAIWKLQVAAAIAHRTGSPGVAASIIEIADAAEGEWLRRPNTRAPEG